MRDKDAIILESLYGVILEGRAETIAILTKAGIPDEYINSVIENGKLVTPEAGVVAKYLLEMQPLTQEKVEHFNNLYKTWTYYRTTRRDPRATQINQYKTFNSFVIAINTMQDETKKKILAALKENFTAVSDEIIERFYDLDKTPDKKEALKLSKWFRRGGVEAQTLLSQYETLKNNNGNLDQYQSYDEFWKAIDPEGYNRANQGEQNDGLTEQALGKAVYKDDRIAIWAVPDVNTSIKYGNGFLGQKYNFCISIPLDSGGSNRFLSYRKTSNPHSFYFVRARYRSNKQKDGGTQGSPNFENPYHMIVVSKHPNDDSWSRTTANNRYNTGPTIGANGQLVTTEEEKRQYPDEYYNTKECSWNDLVRYVPELANHKDIFKFIPVPEDEETILRRYRYISDVSNDPIVFGRRFSQLPPEQQKQYINSGFRVNLVIFKKFSPELRKAFIDTAVTTTADLNKIWLMSFTEDEKKRYITRRKQALIEGIIGQVVM
jgi:hypothetical protein